MRFTDSIFISNSKTIKKFNKNILKLEKKNLFLTRLKLLCV